MNTFEVSWQVNSELHSWNQMMSQSTSLSDKKCLEILDTNLVELDMMSWFLILCVNNQYDSPRLLWQTQGALLLGL
jgi:hypothetical protein